MENKERIVAVEKKNILQRDLSLKEILIVVGIFVIGSVYLGIVVLPRYNEYKNSVDQLEKIQQNINTYESEISTLSVLEKQLSSLNNDIKIERKRLSYNMEDGMFLVGLSNLINSLGVDMVSYTMEDTISYNNFYAIPTTIEVRGNYNYIRRIMSYLEEQKNTTQILDYSMETYIDEEVVETRQTESQVNTNIVNDSLVYWTNEGIMYHKQKCSVLKLEQSASGGEILNGTVDDSKKNTPCETCKPYTTTSVENKQLENTEPKSTGDVLARFKFIMYSTEDAKYGLNAENHNNWKLGKYNPFITTTR